MSKTLRYGKKFTIEYEMKETSPMTKADFRELGLIGEEDFDDNGIELLYDEVKDVCERLESGEAIPPLSCSREEARAFLMSALRNADRTHGSVHFAWL